MDTRGTWEELPPMPHASAWAVSCVIGNELLIAGGNIKSLQIYDIVARTWRVGASLPERLPLWRSDLRGLAVDGKFFVVCLRYYLSMSVYDPMSDKWTVETLPRFPWYHDLSGDINHACVHNGRLVVFTGHIKWHKDSLSNFRIRTVTRFERATDGSWSSSPDFRGRDGGGFVSESVLLG